MISISLKRGPHGIRTAIVAPPYEFIGEFLTAEGSCTESWACDELFRVAQRIKNGEVRSYQKSGDAHAVRITSNIVRITSHYRIPEAEIEVPLDVFLTIVTKWKELVK